jgi:hypothetical protein
MPMDLSSFRKVEGVPAFADRGSARSTGRYLVTVKLRNGSHRPAYLKERASIGERILTAEVAAEQLARLETDPAVESFALSKALPLIE